MAVVIENMNMPRNCDECPFLDDNGDYLFCIVNSKVQEYNFNTRPNHIGMGMGTCPLKEYNTPQAHVVECPYCGSKYYDVRSLLLNGFHPEVEYEYSFKCLACGKDFGLQTSMPITQREAYNA